MRVGISAQKQRLEKHHAGIPDGWGATEIGQEDFAHHRLHPKKQQGALEQREGECT
jgi:hypothetical protein